MINWVLALLVVNKSITLEEADALSHVLTRTTHPQDVEDAVAIVKDVLKDPKQAKLEKT